MEDSLSSMIKAPVVLHRSTVTLFLRTISVSFATGSFPNPIPDQECRVDPPMLLPSASNPIIKILTLRPFQY
jgi:hypothetical protein